MDEERNLTRDYLTASLQLLFDSSAILFQDISPTSDTRYVICSLQKMILIYYNGNGYVYILFLCWTRRLALLLIKRNRVARCSYARYKVSISHYRFSSNFSWNQRSFIAAYNYQAKIEISKVFDSTRLFLMLNRKCHTILFSEHFLRTVWKYYATFRKNLFRLTCKSVVCKFSKES